MLREEGKGTRERAQQCASLKSTRAVQVRQISSTLWKFWGVDAPCDLSTQKVKTGSLSLSLISDTQASEGLCSRGGRGSVRIHRRKTAFSSLRMLG